MLTALVADLLERAAGVERAGVGAARRERQRTHAAAVARGALRGTAEGRGERADIPARVDLGQAGARLPAYRGEVAADVPAALTVGRHGVDAPAGDLRERGRRAT